MAADSVRLDVFTILEPRKEGDKPFWLKLGSAWENRDGSINVVLDALPTNGKLHIREPRPKDEGQQQR